MKKYLKTALFAGSVVLCALNSARGEIVEKWANPDAGMIDAIAVDIDLDGKLEIVGHEGLHLAIINGQTGDIGISMGIIRWPPRVGDLNGDGLSEIAVVFESMTEGISATKLKVINTTWLGYDEMWSPSGTSGFVFGMADINGDGQAELIGGPSANKVGAYHIGPENMLWTYGLGINQQGAFGDVDGDGVLEVVAVKMDTSADGPYSMLKRDNSNSYNEKIYYDLPLIAINGSTGKEEFYAGKLGRQTRPPITADLSGTGSDDIVAFTDEGVRIIQDGVVKTRVDMEGGVYGGAVGNFHPSEGLEIVYMTEKGVVKAIDSEGFVLWEAKLGEISGQPIIADFSGDAEQEILIPTASGTLTALRGSDGTEVFDLDVRANPKSMVVADMDGNGLLDIVVATDLGLKRYETESNGKIEWATAMGDAAGSQSYRLSRDYVERVSHPGSFKLFPWKKVGLYGGLGLIVGLLGLFMYSNLRSAQQIRSPHPAARNLPELERDFAKNRNDRLAIKKLARAYAQSNATGLKAIEVYQKALNINPGDPRIISQLARSYLVRNVLNPESDPIYQKAVEIAPDDKNIISGLVILYSQNKRIDQPALKIYERFYYLGLDNPRATALVARELAEKKNYEPFAVYVYERHLKNEPTDSEVLNTALDHYKKTDNSKTYIAVARPSLESGGLPGTARLRIANDLIEWEFYNEAEHILHQMVTETPDDIDTWWAYKELFARTERYEESRKSAARLVQIYTDLQRANPTFTEYKMALGKLYTELSDPRAAVGQLSTIPEHDDKYQEAAMLLARLYVDLGDPDKAETFFDTVPGAAQRHPELHRKINKLRTSKLLTPSGVDERTMRAGDFDRTAVEKSTPARYLLLEELGRGGMGVVYKAMDTVLNREVAYKILPEDLKNHPQIVENFVREAQSLAALSHPNIVTVFDAGQQAGTLFIVMEYIDGIDLKDELKKHGKMPLKKIVDLIRQVCSALAYAHSKHIAHRDIKTSNVMLAGDGKAQLMDFGLSKVMEDAASAKTAIAGTPYYMSPEQTIGEGVDHRTDIYSLGVMFYELVVGHVPFRSGDIGYHHIHTMPEPPSVANPDVPEAISGIIMKCMEKKKEDRYQSATEILNDLDFAIT